MKLLLILTLALSSLCTHAQKVFFKSGQTFKESHLDNFYSALSIHDSLVIFNANDYRIYAYNKNNGQLLWEYPLGRKSNSQQFIAGGYIWTNKTQEEGFRIGLDGKDPKEFPFSIFSRPHIKNGMAYLTGLYDAGNVLAYDMKADTVAWYAFVAHGCETEPYYLENFIFANAEGNNWMEIDYNGKKKEDCREEEKNDQFVSGCMDNFIVLTHDRKKLASKAAEKLKLDEYSRPKQQNTKNRTFLLHEGSFTMMGNNLKVLYHEELSQKLKDLEDDDEAEIIKANDEEAWLLYSQQLVRFDSKKKRFEIVQDLKEWNPHTVIMDNNQLWIISKNDGLLYGIQRGE